MKYSINNNFKSNNRFFLLFGLFAILNLSSFSQNLVPNPSFEDSIYGTIESNVGTNIDFAEHWFTPRGGGGSSDWFLKALYNQFAFAIPKNVYGYQFAKTGNHYAGIHVGDCPTCYPYREYIEIGLTQSINPARTYYLEFYVCLAERTTYAISNFGVLFSNDSIWTNDIWMGNQPKIHKLHFEYSGQPIIDTMNWTKISGYFKTNDEGYKFMTIGNFRANDSTIYQYVGYDILRLPYYFIDDVLVMDSAQHAQGYGLSEITNNKKRITVYPNPASDRINIEFQDLQQNPLIEIKFYNSMGALVKSLQINKNESNVDVSDLQQGFYIIVVQNKGSILIRQKIVVSR